jgi:hypothetical protein
MTTATEFELKVADQVWVATALLHKENPERIDFSKKEIRDRAALEYPEGAKRPGISLHISTHCVASRAASPARHRMLIRTTKGRRRLFREGDIPHPDRSNGNIMPDPHELPQKYHSLIEWYQNEYKQKAATPVSTSKAKGATAETLMKLIGRISREDADEMIRIIDDCCGRVDANEW